MKCLKRIYLLYIFGLFSNFRPIDPFIYKFFVTYSNLTEEEVSYHLLPTFRYSTALHSLLVFLLISSCGDKLLIIASSILALTSTCTKIWASTILEADISEVFRGASSATEIAYYIYIYSYYDVTNYRHVTAYTRSAALLGKTISSSFVYLVLSKKWIDYQLILYVNLMTNAMSVILSTLLPTAGENLYYLSTPINNPESFIQKITEKVSKFKRNFLESFRQKFIKKWSMWFIWSLWSYNQISTFIQPLWAHLHENTYNALVEACLGLSALFAVLAIAWFTTVNWKKSSVILMPLLTGFQHIFLLSGMAFSNGYILFNYISYVIFGMIHFFVVTGLSAEIAKLQQENCFGIIFGFLYAVANILSAAMTCVANDGLGVYRFRPQEQFFVYFVVFVVLYVVFLAASEIKKRIDTVTIRH